MSIFSFPKGEVEYTVTENEYGALSKSALCKWGHFERATPIKSY